MKVIRLILENGRVIEPGIGLLNGYWEKFILYTIHSYIDLESETIEEIIGEEKMETLYDSISDLLDESYIDSYPEEYLEIGEEIIRSIIEDGDARWVLYGVPIMVSKSVLSELIRDYWNTVIIPYLGIIENQSVLIESDNNDFGLFWEAILLACDVKINHENQNHKQYKNITVLYNKSTIMHWNDKQVYENSSFIINTDLVDGINLKLFLETQTGDIVTTDYIVYFPFFKTGDLVELSIEKKGNKIEIVAVNTTTKLRYVGDI